jgi:hypothetical protein
MNRREMLFGAAAVAAAPLTAFAAIDTGDHSIVKGYVVWTVDVGNLSPQSAEKFCEMLKEKIKNQRKDPNWVVAVRPVRHEESGVSIFVVDKNGDRREVEEFVYDTEEWFHLEWCKATAKLERIEQILKDNNIKIEDGAISWLEPPDPLMPLRITDPSPVKKYYDKF